MAQGTGDDAPDATSYVSDASGATGPEAIRQEMAQTRAALAANLAALHDRIFENPRNPRTGAGTTMATPKKAPAAKKTTSAKKSAAAKTLASKSKPASGSKSGSASKTASMSKAASTKKAGVKKAAATKGRKAASKKSTLNTVTEKAVAVMGDVLAGAAAGAVAGAAEAASETLHQTAVEQGTPDKSAKARPKTSKK